MYRNIIIIKYTHQLFCIILGWMWMEMDYDLMISRILGGDMELIVVCVCVGRVGRVPCPHITMR